MFFGVTAQFLFVQQGLFPLSCKSGRLVLEGKPNGINKHTPCGDFQNHRCLV